MTENNFTTLDGGEYLRVQSKDAKEVLGISKTQFYNDASDNGWQKEEGPRGAVIWYVPRDYAEKRQAEMDQASQPVDAGGDNLKPQAETGGQDKVSPLDTAGLTILNDAFQKLLDEKDKRIADLERQLERERELSDRAITSKENEINTLKGMVLLTGGKDKRDQLPGFQTVEYHPAQAKPAGLMDRLQFWKK